MHSLSSTPPEASYSDSGAKRKYALKGEKKPPASKPSLLVNVPYLDDNGRKYPLVQPLKVAIYAKGAKLFWPCTAPTNRNGGIGGKRGIITDMSMKARLRVAFILGNAPHSWAAMITLTFLLQPENPKEIFDRFTRAFRARWITSCQWAWIMEYQLRGVVHYHVFLGADFFDVNRDARPKRIDAVFRRGCKTSIHRGVLDDWTVDAWCAATRCADPKFRRFQEGGIIEAFRTPDAAARYVAKEASKRHQKQLPEGVAGGRRWYWCSKQCKPKQLGRAVLKAYPFTRPLGQIFDKKQLEGLMSNYEDMTPPLLQSKLAI